MSEAQARRKLTTILAADVVGYSQMMAVDEEATVATLRTFRTVADDLVGKHNGRIFSTAGDAFLAEFGSAVEAVRCAISIQEDLAVRNSELPDEKQMWFRIGVNVGDVMIEKEDLFGDGVNVAARLEGLAETGGICISGSTFDQVKNKLSIGFDDIGPQRVKNIPEPIPAFRIVPGKVTVAGTGRRGHPAGPKRDRSLKLAVAGAAITIVLAAAYLLGLQPLERVTAQPFDGDWKVTVDSLSGCLDNSPKSYPIRITDGKIDEPQHQLPKTGTVSPEGDVSIKVTDRSGNLRNTQVAKIAGDIGTGRFQGRKPSCSGQVTMVRMQ
jgi:class 3 adenylate cyclase